MKTQLPLLCIFLFLSYEVVAQCIPAVPSNAVVINSIDTINGGFDPIWVCSGDTIISDGGFHNIFLEPGAVMKTSGGIDTIYVKDGASFFMNGGIHVIFFVTLSDLNIGGGIPTKISCTDILFDYSNAPQSGCETATIASLQSSDSSICIDGCIDFTNLSLNATSWQWSFPGGNPSSSTDENPANICYNTAGSFDVTLIATNGSVNDTLFATNFITVSLPSTLTLSQSGDTIMAPQGYSGYQWYFDNNPISGATNYFHIVSQGGDYTLVAIDSNGCEVSALIKVIFSVITDVGGTDNGIVAFPNPASDVITVVHGNNTILGFFDLTGRKILSLTGEISGSTEIDISAFPAVFFIRSEQGRVIKVARH